MKAKTATISLCPCGFPFLNESITLGTEYEVDPERRATFTFICGGCGRVAHGVDCLFCESRGKSKGGYLPVALFGLADKPKWKVEEHE